MPEISRFYGVVIRIFFNDHPPPHFHAEYEGSAVQISMETLDVLAGSISRRALVLVLEWAQLHRQELKEDWELCRRKEQPKKIQPLD